MNRHHSITQFIQHTPFAHLLPIAALAMAAFLILHALYARSTQATQAFFPLRSGWAKLVYVVFWLISIILALTSFGSIIAAGKMEHQALFVHIMAAGAFTAVMVAFALWWNPLVGRSNPMVEFDSRASRSWWLGRWSLWTILLASFAVAASMLLGMLPLFDTEQMHLSIALHRYFGLLLLAGLVVHLYSLLIQWIGWR